MEGEKDRTRLRVVYRGNEVQIQMMSVSLCAVMEAAKAAHGITGGVWQLQGPNGPLERDGDLGNLCDGAELTLCKSADLMKLRGPNESWESGKPGNDDVPARLISPPPPQPEPSPPPAPGFREVVQDRFGALPEIVVQTYREEDYRSWATKPLADLIAELHVVGMDERMAAVLQNLAKSHFLPADPATSGSSTPTVSAKAQALHQTSPKQWSVVQTQEWLERCYESKALENLEGKLKFLSAEIIMQLDDEDIQETWKSNGLGRATARAIRDKLQELVPSSAESSLRETLWNNWNWNDRLHFRELAYTLQYRGFDECFLLPKKYLSSVFEGGQLSTCEVRGGSAVFCTQAQMGRGKTRFCLKLVQESMDAHGSEQMHGGAVLQSTTHIEGFRTRFVYMSFNGDSNPLPGGGLPKFLHNFLKYNGVEVDVTQLDYGGAFATVIELLFSKLCPASNRAVGSTGPTCRAIVLCVDELSQLKTDRGEELKAQGDLVNSLLKSCDEWNKKHTDRKTAVLFTFISDRAFDAVRESSRRSVIRHTVPQLTLEESCSLLDEYATRCEVQGELPSKRFTSDKTYKAVVMACHTNTRGLLKVAKEHLFKSSRVDYRGAIGTAASFVWGDNLSTLKEESVARWLMLGQLDDRDLDVPGGVLRETLLDRFSGTKTYSIDGLVLRAWALRRPTFLSKAYFADAEAQSGFELIAEKILYNFEAAKRCYDEEFELKDYYSSANHVDLPAAKVRAFPRGGMPGVYELDKPFVANFAEALAELRRGQIVVPVPGEAAVDYFVPFFKGSTLQYVALVQVKWTGRWKVKGLPGMNPEEVRTTLEALREKTLCCESAEVLSSKGLVCIPVLYTLKTAANENTFTWPTKCCVTYVKDTLIEHTKSRLGELRLHYEK